MLVEVSEVTRRFGSATAVDALSFTLDAGQIFAFVGPNGAGKTTTMRIMSTLDDPDEGDVRIDGISVTQYPEKTRRLFGYMPDSLPEHRDVVVWEYLDFFARSFGIRGRERTTLLNEIEGFCGLGSMREKSLRSLSKGMKQRVSLARALIHDPPLLILDEPAAGLDPRARIELRRLMGALSDRGKAILISSHILSELEDVAHGAVIIEQGRLIRAGTLDELSKSPSAVSTNGVADPAHARVLTVRTLGDPRESCVAALETPGVLAAEVERGRLIVRLDDTDAAAAALIKTLVERGHAPVEIVPARAGLERIFMDSTKGDVQ